jgi:hypothetical protein
MHVAQGMRLSNCSVGVATATAAKSVNRVEMARKFIVGGWMW